MKSTLKILGIIALVAVIGFSMAACGGEEEDDGGGTIAKVKMVNNYANTITRVRFGTRILDESVSIANGKDQTFSVDMEDFPLKYYTGTIYLYADGLTYGEYASQIIEINQGKTTTVTLGSDGNISW